MNNVFPRMHVSLYVSNIAKTVEFYTTFFGQEATKIKPGYAKFVLEKPSLIISFVENPARVQSNFGHLGFQVETLAELEEKLAAAREKKPGSQRRIGHQLLLCQTGQILGNRPGWRTMGGLLFSRRCRI